MNVYACQLYPVHPVCVLSNKTMQHFHDIWCPNSGGRIHPMHPACTLSTPRTTPQCVHEIWYPESCISVDPVCALSTQQIQHLHGIWHPKCAGRTNPIDTNNYICLTFDPKVRYKSALIIAVINWSEREVKPPSHHTRTFWILQIHHVIFHAHFEHFKSTMSSYLHRFTHHIFNSYDTITILNITQISIKRLSTVHIWIQCVLCAQFAHNYATHLVSYNRLILLPHFWPQHYSKHIRFSEVLPLDFGTRSIYIICATGTCTKCTLKRCQISDT